MAPLQWGPGTEGAHVEPYMQFATRHAARKLVDLGMLPFDGDARRGAEARLAAHLVKILVNVETKAALCAGPQVLAARHPVATARHARCDVAERHAAARRS